MLSACNYSPAVSSDPHSFDWYRATVHADRFDVLEALLSEFPGEGFTLRAAPAVRFFGEGEALFDADDCRVFAIYMPSDGLFPNVLTSGFYSDRVAAVIRSFEHRPSRVDVCLDLVSDGLFSSLSSWSERFAASAGICRSTIVNDDPDLGATIYLGSRTSAVFVRIYQPGLLRARNEGRTGADISEADRSAVRIELELKPQTAKDKLTASTLDPEALWGWSRWSRALYLHCTGLDAARVGISKPSESDRARALRHMAKQYGKHLSSLMSELHGDTEAFGAAIWDVYSKSL